MCADANDDVHRVAGREHQRRHPVEAGATVVRPVQDEFYGDRMGMVACPFGYRWSLAQPKEEVSPEEMQKRWTKMLGAGKA